MTAADTQSTKLQEIDGHIVSESVAGLVQIRVAQGERSHDLKVGDSVAFRPMENVESEDRFLGTVVAVGSPDEVTLLLDRVALTLALTTEQREVTPFDPAVVHEAHGRRIYGV